MADQTLLTASANATGAAKDITSGSHSFKSHLRTIYAYGTWDSATVIVQASHDGGTTWVPTGISITADGLENLEIRGTHVRGVVSGGLGSESINLVMF